MQLRFAMPTSFRIERGTAIATGRALAGLGLGLAMSVPCLAENLPDVSAQPPWALHARDDDPSSGYRVFKRKPLGSKFSAYRLEAVIDAPPDLVAEAAARMFSDPDAHEKNMDKTVLQDDENVIVIYTHVHLALVSDRDITTRAVRSYDPETQTHRIAWRATDGGPAPKNGVIRVRDSAGFWEFSPLGERQTRAVYETHTEVAGFMPAWLVNRMMNRNIAQAITGMRERVEQERNVLHEDVSASLSN